MITEMEQANITSPALIIVAFCSFLIAPSLGQQGSSWTYHCGLPIRHPSMQTYLAVEVYSTLQPTDLLIKIDLKSEFFQTPSHLQCTKYGTYYLKKKHWLNQLPMGHPMAMSIMQRLEQAVTHSLHQNISSSMIAWLDNWLIFHPLLPVEDTVQHIQDLGLTINKEKSTLTPNTTTQLFGTIYQYN